MSDSIIQNLFALRDEDYRAFQLPLIPSLDPQRMIGVRTPQLRALAKRLRKEQPLLTEAFLGELPHRYFEEDQLHAFIISEEKDFSRCLKQVGDFLPFVDNWATCDQLSPRVFRRFRPQLLERIPEWIASGRCYTVRFGIGMLMQHFLDEDFDPALLELTADIRSDEYYVNMMVAWYFATALAKQYVAALPYIKGRRLARWTHNKTIQKALESYRVSPEHKQQLKALKWRA